MSGKAAVGTVVPVKPETFAAAVEGFIWVLKLDGTAYEAQFMGTVDSEGRIEMLLKKEIK